MSETKDWRKICTDCQEGEPPKDCEYFGEPGGCNAPTMGKHPTCKESLQVGNAAAMLKALQEIQLVCWKAGGAMGYDVACGIIKAKSRAALSKPPRNCDLLANEQEALASIHNDRGYVQNPIEERKLTVDYLFAEAKGEQK